MKFECEYCEELHEDKQGILVNYREEKRLMIMCLHCYKSRKKAPRREEQPKSFLGL